MDKSKLSYRYMFAACCALAVFWWAVLSHGGSDEYKSADGIAALFSGWAFIAMFFALKLQAGQSELQSEQLKMQNEELRLQREELKLQRAELEATRQELAKTAEANAASAELARKNLRAQYLMYWLDENTSKFREARLDVGRSDSLIRVATQEIEKIKEFESFDDYLEWHKSQGMASKFDPALSIDGLEKEINRSKMESEKHRLFCAQYDNLKQELGSLTQELNQLS